jgi:hypothetical protein
MAIQAFNKDKLLFKWKKLLESVSLKVEKTKSPSTMSLKVLSHHSLIGTLCIGDGGGGLSSMRFFLRFFSLFSP